MARNCFNWFHLWPVCHQHSIPSISASASPSLSIALSHLTPHPSLFLLLVGGP